MKLIYTGDFERLKEFGFKKDKFFGYLLLENKNNNWDKIIAEINEKTRLIKFDINNTPDEINDLIQAGLVKKEEDIEKEKEEEFSNIEAISFFGKTIVEQLEQQHQDGYPSYFKRTSYYEWEKGCVGEYIVLFEDKKYKVTVVDNVLRHPLYINQIEKWEEIKDE